MQRRAAGDRIIHRSLRRPIGWMVVVACTAAASARSAPQRAEDPDWPCQQRLVPNVTAAAYWNGTLDMQGDWQADPEVSFDISHPGQSPPRTG